MSIASPEHLLHDLADQLWAAEQSATAIPPMTDPAPGLDIAGAYRVQLLNIQRKLDRGERVTGKKIGLTSVAMQELLGVRQPDYGHLLASMEVIGGATDRASLVQPRVEAELAFILKSGLPTSGVTPEAVLAATGYVVPALEIVDSRITDWKISLVDTVADNASSGRYVLGTHRIDPLAVDLREISMELSKNGSTVNSGQGSAVLGDPALAVAWLANAVGEYGVSLDAGEVVLSGAMAAMVAVEAGDTVTARFDGFEEVSVRFT
ncbi:MAG: fumarylacetoacetate hydrolase family protein [Propionicimonas sp.]|nr:fumarylacetoacetate hydrolase family protein [Propionicimonas sp.]